MKNPIEWHEKYLRNMCDHAERLSAEADRAGAKATNVLSDCDFLRQQINEAKRKGKDGFDPDRFMRKVGLKSW